VDAGRRPRLARELDRLLPELLELLWAHRARGTFFVLGEVARDLPARVREISLAGHEVGSHGFRHLRADELSVERFLAEARDSKRLLEDLVGQEVVGFRAPEWSLRTVSNPRLRRLVELGYRYDSSLAPWPGAGRRANPRRVTRLTWPEGESILEAPPLSFGGRLGLPASGWPARLAAPERIARAASRAQREGGLPVIVVHPWELSGALTPGELTGLGRAIHEVGRLGYRERFPRLLEAHPWRPMREALIWQHRSEYRPTRIAPADDIPTPVPGRLG
jgi:peptidoglycan/xylan/chitin deacetylase (PgdA/CDA1 family)